jgi:hypothetical protein
VTSVAALLNGHERYSEFRRIVHELFPDEEEEILGARSEGVNRETARVWAFCRVIEARHFPIYELEEYEQVVIGIPFIREGWSYDGFHELDLRPGELLLFILCAHPYDGTRLPALDAAGTLVPDGILLQIPADGFSPAELHERLDDTPYAAAAAFADWLWGETGTVFLDFDDEVDADVEWSRQNILELTEQWRRVETTLSSIADLASWLETSPAVHFVQLLDAAIGSDARLTYMRTRRFYAYEITEAGIVPVLHDPDAVALPPGATC